MWEMAEGIQNELQMFENPMETAEIGKLTMTSEQLSQRKITITMNLCKWRRTKRYFSGQMQFWDVKKKKLIIILKLKN